MVNLIHITQSLRKIAAAAFLLFIITGCEGDVRPLTESVEVSDLKLVSILVEPPANSITEVSSTGEGENTVQTRRLGVGVGEQVQMSLVGINTAGKRVALSPNDRRWSVSSNSLSINDNGLVTGLANGSAAISVRVADLESDTSLSIEASDAPLEGIASIRVTPRTNEAPASNPDPAENEQFPCVGVNYTAYGQYGNLTRALSTVNWNIDTASIQAGAVLFTVNSPNGTNPNAIAGTTNLIGRRPGQISLTATVPANEQAGTAEFTTTQVLTVNTALTAIAISPDNVSIDVSQNSRLQASGTYTGDAPNSMRAITRGVEWRVIEGTEVVEVGTFGTGGADPGLLTGQTSGTATVQANCGEFTAEALVVVSNSSGSLAFNFSDTIEIELRDGVFDELELSTGERYSSADNVTESADWFSSNAEVLTVSNRSGSKGEITPIAVGEAQVSASFDGVVEEITIRVR